MFSDKNELMVSVIHSINTLNAKKDFLITGNTTIVILRMMEI